MFLWKRNSVFVFTEDEKLWIFTGLVWFDHLTPLEIYHRSNGQGDPVSKRTSRQLAVMMQFHGLLQPRFNHNYKFSWDPHKITIAPNQQKEVWKIMPKFSKYCLGCLFSFKWGCLEMFNGHSQSLSKAKQGIYNMEMNTIHWYEF